MICINCGNEIKNPKVNCPHCGYRFTANESIMCPNLYNGPICPFTRKICNKGIDFMTCSHKLKADREAPF